MDILVRSGLSKIKSLIDCYLRVFITMEYQKLFFGDEKNPIKNRSKLTLHAYLPIYNMLLIKLALNINNSP